MGDSLPSPNVPDYLNPATSQHAMEVFQPSNKHTFVGRNSMTIVSADSDVVQVGIFAAIQFHPWLWQVPSPHRLNMSIYIPDSFKPANTSNTVSIFIIF